MSAVMPLNAKAPHFANVPTTFKNYKRTSFYIYPHRRIVSIFCALSLCGALLFLNLLNALRSV